MKVPSGVLIKLSSVFTGARASPCEFLAYFIVSHPGKNYLNCPSVSGNKHNFPETRNCAREVRGLFCGSRRQLQLETPCLEVDFVIFAIALVSYLVVNRCHLCREGVRCNHQACHQLFQSSLEARQFMRPRGFD